jgi:hypothetical protein
VPGQAEQTRSPDGSARAWVIAPGVEDNGTPIAMGSAHNGLIVYSIADAAWNKWSGAAWAVFP